MPKVIDYPAPLKPYRFHGLDLQYRVGEEEATADCPFCGREGKFSVNIATGLSKCWVCGEGTARGGMNSLVFLRQLWEHGDRATTAKDYRDLVSDRGLLGVDTLVHWGACRSPITGDWLVPGYDLKGNLSQLYRYVQPYDGGEKHLLLPTPGLSHQIFGMPLYNSNRSTVYLCEGPWCAMALWEVLGQCRYDEDGRLRETASLERSLLGDANVLGAPGCNVFKERWTPLFADKTVYLLYDNDHPKHNPRTGSIQQPAGLVGMRRAAGMLSEAKEPPSEIYYLRWGPEGYDEGLPSGYDVRDTLLRVGSTRQDTSLGVLGRRLVGLASLQARLHPVPQEWLRRSTGGKGDHTSDTPNTGGGLQPIPCNSYATVVRAWEEAMRWTDGLDRALVCILASVVTTQMVGEQLWFKIISPASGGKTTIAEGVAVATSFVLSKDTIRGFHTGWRTEDKEDRSLAALANGKTLITKDGDTLLKSPNLLQILSEGRALYDRVSRTHYRNDIDREYLGHRMTWILCGTPALREIDDSELGVRFLDCVIMDRIDDNFEDEVGLRAVYQEARAMLAESDGEPASQYPKELAKAMSLTGGYVEHLRHNAPTLLGQVPLTKRVARECQRLGKFIAYIRARVPKNRDDDAGESGREFSARLNKQLVRLALATAVVLQRTEVDAEVMRRVRQVALDTGRGNTLSVTSLLYDEGQRGMSMSSLGLLLKGPSVMQVQRLLRFLRRIEAVELYEERGKGKAHQLRWRLTERMRLLYESVMEMEDG